MAPWQIPEIGVGDIADDAYVLDVREADEWEAGHAPGAHHVPMMQIPMRAGELPTDRDIVVVCRVGARSAQVVAYLRAQGFDRVANLDGGMYAWQASGRPVVTSEGRAGQVL
ncbi:MAG TPA: rhodanese-like domain-containing protein [Micromonosporaceae bacterium]|nr:rhodanese-like domain-containing protein [Micromonosporaceae bacterium]